MKTILLTIATMSCISLTAQVNEPTEQKEGTVTIDTLTQTVTIDNGGDTTRIKLGKKNIVIVEKKEEGKNGEKKVIIDERVIIEDGEDVVEIEDEDEKEDGKGEAHWAGFGINTNGFLNADGKIATGDAAGFLELDHARSIGFNFNLVEKRFPIFREYVGITTGLGLQWNRYALKNNVDVMVSADSTYGVENLTVDYKKNVLRSTYLQIPLLLEITTNKDNDKAWHISAGVVGGIRIGSSLKTKWEEDGKTNKDKVKSNHNFNPFEAHATAIVGYGNISLYVNYGLTQVFEKGKGPDYAPVSAGVLLHF
ncbi:MAG: PorT family protein [Flavobacteriales bacterium]|nr:PorT family protein [Flavobacteriales bacterium]